MAVREKLTAHLSVIFFLFLDAHPIATMAKRWCSSHLSMLHTVNEALFYTGVTTLFRDPRGGLSLVPLITFSFCLFCVDNF